MRDHSIYVDKFSMCSVIICCSHSLPHHHLSLKQGPVFVVGYYFRLNLYVFICWQCHEFKRKKKQRIKKTIKNPSLIKWSQTRIQTHTFQNSRICIEMVKAHSVRKCAFYGINFNVNVGCIKGIKRELNQIEWARKKGRTHIQHNTHNVGATGF